VHSDHIAGDAPGSRRRVDLASRHAASPGDRQRLTPSRDRVIAMVLLGRIAAALMGFEFQFRHLEAYAAAHLYSPVTSTIAASSAPIIWFGLSSPGAFGLVITPDCSSALPIAPLCLLGVVLLIPHKLAVDRVMKALTVAAVILVAGT
jgi:hypothetical protein